MSVSVPQAPKSWRRWTAISVAVVVLGGVAGWASTVVLTPPRDLLESTAFTYVEVVQGEVGSSLTLNTVASWSPIPVGTNLAGGTVTSVAVNPGQEVGQGAVLYTVNLRPVVIATGAIPAFQSLSQGSRGADVAQLQAMLTAAGYFRGAADGIYSWTTASAVRAWQKHLGITPDGVVQAGDIVFVPSLPTRVALDTTIVKRGAVLAGGEPVVSALPAEPEFTIPVTNTQAGLIPLATRVKISGPDGVPWEGYVDGQTSDAQGGISLTLTGKDAGTVCGDDCAKVPVIGQTLLLSTIVTVESVVGLTVPSAALLSKADGTLAVIGRNGREHAVTVVASARGMSVIDGVAAGIRVRVPAAQG